MNRHKKLKRYVQLELIPPRQFLCCKLDLPSSLLLKKKRVNICGTKNDEMMKESLKYLFGSDKGPRLLTYI